MRPSSEKNGGFTLTQVYLWLGYQQQALESFDVDETIVKVIIETNDHISATTPLYNHIGAFWN